MENKILHVISFDVPYPANYGGVIDVWYKIKALHDKGVQIILHCFSYGRGHQKMLDDYCVEVNYYERKKHVRYHFANKPFIVESRKNKTLLERLQEDTHPILFEGLHSTYYLCHRSLKDRVKWVRTHNIEHDYYQGLSLVEKNFFRKKYFQSEAKKLENYQDVLRHATGIFAISQQDQRYLSKIFNSVIYLKAFHPFKEVIFLEKKEKFALYHGNLSVAENQEAVLYLIDEVFVGLNCKLVIAGSGAPVWLKNKIKAKKNIVLDEESSMDHITKLLRKAQINVLPTFQPTGIKLKLLFALYNGGHCLVNNYMVANTGLESTCRVADNPKKMQQEILGLLQKPFTELERDEREQNLRPFSSSSNAELLINSVWNL